jgi:hypothetical protein
MGKFFSWKKKLKSFQRGAHAGGCQHVKTWTSTLGSVALVAEAVITEDALLPS